MARKSRYRSIRLLALAMILLSGPVLALGLGDIQVRSHLDEPFSAVIPLTINSPSDLNGLSVSLGSAAAFRRAGIEPTDALSSLHFEVNTHGSNPVIDVTSQQPVREPYLNFLVQAQWNAGTLLREYTVLMNPPGANDAAPAPTAEVSQTAPASMAETPVVQEPAAKSAPTPPPPSKSKPKPHVTARAPVASAPRATPSPADGSAAEIRAGTNYGPVKPGETFWSIATRVRPNAGLTMDQVLLAIYDANRSAFEQGNFNGLMKGQVLDIPSADAMRSVTASTAQSRVRALRRRVTPAASPPPAEKPKAAGITSAPSVSRTSPEPAQAAPETSSAETLMGGKTSNPKPAAASSSSVANAENSQQPVAPSTGATLSATNATAVLPALSASAAAAEASPVTEKPMAAAPATVAAPVVVKTKPVVQPTVSPAGSKKTGNDLVVLIEQFRWPILGFLVLVALAILLIRSRRQRAEVEAESNAAPPRRPIGSTSDPMKTAEADSGDIEVGDADIVTLAAGSAAAAAAATSSLGEAPAPMRSLQDESEGFDAASAGDAKTFDLSTDGAEDPLAEADFHLAYGLFDEAILLLQNALAKTPHRMDLQMKLAECYAAAGKPLEFQALAEELESRTTPEEWAQLCQQGRKLCPGVALFEDGDHPAPPAEAETTAAEAGEGPEAEVVSERAQTPGDNIIDFEPAPSEAAKMSEPPPATAKVESFDLSDFDSFGGSDEKAPDNRVDFKLDDLDLSDAMSPSETGPGPAAQPRSGNDDEFATKLDLARAYSDMGDNEAARSLLDEVMQGGSAALKVEAEALAKQLGG